MPDGTRKYIACQGCLQHTVADFWRLIVQERCTVIVMITKLVEDGKNKCFQYWPSVDEGSKSFNVYQGTITVTLDGTENYANFVRRTLTVEMKIEKGKMKGRENVSWTVYQYHFMEWMDKRIPTPERTDSILSFIGDINNQWKENNYAGPLVVHCSAGIGRTGTFIVIDCVLNQIKKRGLECDIDIAKTITSLRSQRSGLVQTDLQYKFIYLAIKRYIELERCPAAKSSNDNKDLYENIPASAFGSAGVGRGIAPPTAVKPQKAVSKQQVAQQLVAAVATKSRVKQPNDAAGDRQPVPADAAAVQGLVYENLDTVRLTAAGRVGTVRRQP
jgi:tyrosine-protein phosphatase non-receptor type 11